MVERDPVVEALIDGFAAEARTICQKITNNVLELEHADELDEDAKRSHYEELARGLHTLKGNSDTFGFPQLAELAHKLEDIVALYRPSLATLPADKTDLMLRGLDVFIARLAARNQPAEQPPLDDLLSALKAARTGPAPPAAATPPATRPKREAQKVAPPAEEPIETTLEEWRIGPQHVEALMREIERMRELRLRLDEQKREVERGMRALHKLRAAELSEFRDLLTNLSRSLGSDSDETGDIVDSLEQELKTIATLPVRWVLDPMQRSVRDLCRALGKEAKLSTVGGEISLDRRLLEALKAPLVHLVRNALDHGIERPEQRIAAGKYREGALTIRVERTGNMVFIEVIDDGAGIDPTLIKQRAIARGLISEDEAETIHERELQQLLFRPGFSTRTEVTELSGRGVGLDIVRAAVQAAGGHVELHSVLGSGSRFLLSMPVSLGSTPILVVRVDEQSLGLPMAAVETIRSVRPEDVQVGRTGSRFRHQEQMLRLIDLATLLALRPQVPLDTGRPVLIMKARGQLLAIAVDQVIGDRDLVLRPLPAELHDLPAYQGAATLARGDLLLVLQPDFFVDNQAVTSPVVSARRALVVDDSLTARALHRTMLESGGYQVHTVGNARQALDHLRHAYYDVVVADVMMADIDGVKMTSMLRSRRETAGLPIILVSAHDSMPERERGLAAGADSFLSKKDCISGRLLAEVAAVIARRERR